MAVQGDDERLSRQLVTRQVRTEPTRVEIDGVPPRRFDNLDAGRQQLFAHVPGAADPVSQVVLVKHLAEALRHRLEVATGESAVGHVAFGQDDQLARASQELGVTEQQQTTRVHDAVLLGADGRTVRHVEHLPHDRADRTVVLPGLALLDEPGVLCEPAGVQEQRHPVPVADQPGGPEVLEAHRLPATRVARHRAHDQGHVGALGGQQGLEPPEVEIALERVAVSRVGRLRYRQVDRPRAAVLDVGPGRVEMRVARHGLPSAAQQLEEDALAGAPLVGRQRVLEPGDVTDGIAEPVEAGGAGVAFVGSHDPGPLLCTHRTRAAVGEQIDEHLIRIDLEQVEPGATQDLLALRWAGETDGLDDLDPERLDDGLHRASIGRGASPLASVISRGPVPPRARPDPAGAPTLLRAPGLSRLGVRQPGP